MYMYITIHKFMYMYITIHKFMYMYITIHKFMYIYIRYTYTYTVLNNSFTINYTGVDCNVH